MKMKVQPNNQKLKKDLEKKLNEIQKQEQKDKEILFNKLLELCKSEIDEVVLLSNFRSSGKVSVELSYEIILDHGGLDEQKSLDDEIDTASCYVDIVKEPKGFEIAQFIASSKCCDLCIETLKEVSRISPETKDHINKFLKAKKTLFTKIKKVAKKLGVNEKEYIEKCVEEVSEQIYRNR